MKLHLWIGLGLVSLLFTAPGAGLADRDAGVGAPGYRPANSTSLHKSEPRSLKAPLVTSDVIVRIPITGTIDLGLAAFVRRALSTKAGLFVLDINTLGGRVDAAIQIRDALLQSDVQTVAYIHPRAISAGALISLACDLIAIAPGGSIGAATPISSEGEMTEAVAEKMTSYMRTEMRAAAEANGRRGDLAEAMVDREVVIDGIVPAGKLLTLDTARALEYKIADMEVSSIDELLTRLGAERGRVVSQEESWAEKLARFLTDPAVSGMLMSLGMLGLMVELYSPGLGLPGAVGVLCLASFFFGHAIADLAGVEEAVLLVAGVVLMLLEVFVIPGFGVAGIAGLLCLFLALAFTLVDLPLSDAMGHGILMDAVERVSLSVLVAVGLGLVLVRFLPRTVAGRRLVLGSSTAKEDGFVSAATEDDLVGQTGVASTPLRPAGKARFGHRTIDVVTTGGYVEAGQSVIVMQTTAGRVVVEEARPPDVEDETK